MSVRHSETFLTQVAFVGYFDVTRQVTNAMMCVLGIQECQFTETQNPSQ